MKLLVFGSVNIDHVYQLPHFVREGETLSAQVYARNAGGKGFNQAVALAKAGQKVHFAGAIGEDGLFLKQQLTDLGVCANALRTVSAPTGHAMIQVNAQGSNSIILYSGANGCVTPEMIKETLDALDAGDYVLMQNEISCGACLLEEAHKRGLRVALNPSPVSKALLAWPLELVDLFLLNEIEGEDITGKHDPEEILSELLRRFPGSKIVLTLGADGAIYADAKRRFYQPVIPAKAVDTTAAGDTFTGYFLHGLLSDGDVQNALLTAAKAAAITVSRPGAGQSIPWMEEVKSNR